MTEVWKQLNRFPAYAVSSLGRIKRIKPGRSTKSGRILKQIFHAKIGYNMVNLSIGGKITQIFVHQLIAEAFLGQCPPGQEVNHKDTDKINNNQSNLEYVSRKQNTIHAAKHGLIVGKKGEECNMSKLTKNDVTEIIFLIRKKLTQKQIANRFQVDPSTISRIKNGYNWRWFTNVN